jgi:hypothetical protein
MIANNFLACGCQWLLLMLLSVDMADMAAGHDTANLSRYDSLGS